MIYFILFYFLFIPASSTNEQCFANNDKSECAEKHDVKFSKEANIYPFLQEYKYANNAYQPCNKTGCKCFVDVINNDLKPFQNGITEEMISQNYLGIIMQSNFNANTKY